MARQIILDTETTGFSYNNGDRIIEVGCVELINNVPTGKTFQRYINPERDIPLESQRICGITNDFVKNKPLFKDIARDFLDFIGGDSAIIAHNADFDYSFLNMELNVAGFEDLDYERVIDTLKIARKKFPGARNSLDALCERFNIDNSHRELHGALLDSQILMEVYIELIGGKEPGLGFSTDKAQKARSRVKSKALEREFKPPRDFPITPTEEEAHKEFLKRFVNPLWDGTNG
jgi:DNA polymerase-3 subunit epsilon